MSSIRFYPICWFDTARTERQNRAHLLLRGRVYVQSYLAKNAQLGFPTANMVKNKKARSKARVKLRDLVCMQWI